MHTGILIFKCVAFRTEPPPELAVALVPSCSVQPAAMTTIQGQVSGQLPASVSPSNCFVRNLIAALFFTLSSGKQVSTEQTVETFLSSPQPTPLVPSILFL